MNSKEFNEKAVEYVVVGAWLFLSSICVLGILSGGGYAFFGTIGFVIFQIGMCLIEILSITEDGKRGPLLNIVYNKWFKENLE